MAWDGGQARALRSEHPKKMAILGPVPHASGYRAIYYWIALELGYTLVLKSHVQFIGSKVMAKNVTFSGCQKWTFLTFAGRRLGAETAREARLDAF